MVGHLVGAPAAGLDLQLGPRDVSTLVIVPSTLPTRVRLRRLRLRMGMGRLRLLKFWLRSSCWDQTCAAAFGLGSERGISCQHDSRDSVAVLLHWTIVVVPIRFLDRGGCIWDPLRQRWLHLGPPRLRVEERLRITVRNIIVVDESRICCSQDQGQGRG